MKTQMRQIGVLGLAFVLVLMPAFATTSRIVLADQGSSGVVSQSNSRNVVVDDPRVPLAAGACACTTYVYNYEQGSLTSNYPAAKDWGSWLLGQNWYVDHGFNQGDIIVFPAGSTLANTNYNNYTLVMSSSGHVGILAGPSTYLGNHQWRVTLQSANIQAGEPLFTSFNCLNVSLFTGTINDTVVTAYSSGGRLMPHLAD